MTIVTFQLIRNSVEPVHSERVCDHVEDKIR